MFSPANLIYTARDSKIGENFIGFASPLNVPRSPNLFKLGSLSNGFASFNFEEPLCYHPISGSFPVYSFMFIHYLTRSPTSEPSAHFHFKNICCFSARKN
jgi:hypothetical protein